MSMNAFHARSRRPALAPSRSRARQLIEAGSVHADGMLVTRPGQLLPEGVVLAVVVE